MTSKLTVDQVRDVLENDLRFNWGSLEWNNNAIAGLLIDGEVFDFDVVDSKFGHEGDYHTDTFIVVKVGDQHFRKTGYYASHDGSYWDGPLTEVEGYTKNVILWRDK